MAAPVSAVPMMPALARLTMTARCRSIMNPAVLSVALAGLLAGHEISEL